MSTEEKKHWIKNKILRRTLKTLGVLLLLLILLPFTLYIPWVQNVVKDYACEYASKKTGLDISIDRILIKFPLDLSVDGVLILDQNKDTMLRAENLTAGNKLVNCFQISNELFHIVRDITNIEGLGWQLRGNIAALNFELYDERDQVIAVISQKFLSLHDKYCVDIYQPEHEQAVVAILVTLQHMIKDREARSSFSSSSSSSSGSN